MSDEPTTSELERLIARNHRETTHDIAKLELAIAAQRADFDRYVLAQVYEADKRATADRERTRDDRIKKLEEEATVRARGNRAAFWAAGSAVAAAIVGAVMAYLLAKGGGH